MNQLLVNGKWQYEDPGPSLEYHHGAYNTLCPTVVGVRGLLPAGDRHPPLMFSRCLRLDLTRWPPHSLPHLPYSPKRSHVRPSTSFIYKLIKVEFC